MIPSEDRPDHSAKAWEEVLSIGSIARRTSTRFAVLAIGSALAFTACSDDAADDGGDDRTIEVTAADYEFEDLPEKIAVGTRIMLRNDSDKELHELVAVRIADDEDRAVKDLIELPEEELGSALAPGDPGDGHPRSARRRW